MRILSFTAVLLLSILAHNLTLANVAPIREVWEPSSRYNAQREVKVAVVQWNPERDAPLNASERAVERYKEGNRRALIRFIREAAGKGAELVITPEFGVVGYPAQPHLTPEEQNFTSTREIRPFAERIPGPTTEKFSRLAKELKIYLHIGLAEEDRGRIYNTVVALNPDGEIVAKYRKSHLYMLENEYLTPGRQAAYYDAPFGRVGIVICSDIYSGFPISQYRRDGVKVLALSTSWAQANTGMDHFQSAARQAGMYVLASNHTYFPDSGVVNPDGRTQSHIRQSGGIAYGFLPRVPKRTCENILKRKS